MNSLPSSPAFFDRVSFSQLEKKSLAQSLVHCAEKYCSSSNATSRKIVVTHCKGRTYVYKIENTEEKKAPWTKTATKIAVFCSGAFLFLLAVKAVFRLRSQFVTVIQDQPEKNSSLSSTPLPTPTASDSTSSEEWDNGKEIDTPGKEEIKDKKSSSKPQKNDQKPQKNDQKPLKTSQQPGTDQSPLFRQPREIQQLIAEFVIGKGSAFSFKDFHNLSRTCKRGYELAQVHLRQHWKIANVKQQLNEIKQMEKDDRQLYIKSFFQDPAIRAISNENRRIVAKIRQIGFFGQGEAFLLYISKHTGCIQAFSTQSNPVTLLNTEPRTLQNINKIYTNNKKEADFFQIALKYETRAETGSLSYHVEDMDLSEATRNRETSYCIDIELDENTDNWFFFQPGFTHSKIFELLSSPFARFGFVLYTQKHNLFASGKKEICRHEMDEKDPQKGYFTIYPYQGKYEFGKGGSILDRTDKKIVKKLDIQHKDNE